MVPEVGLFFNRDIINFSFQRKTLKKQLKKTSLFHPKLIVIVTIAVLLMIKIYNIVKNVGYSGNNHITFYIS